MLHFLVNSYSRSIGTCLLSDMQCLVNSECHIGLTRFETDTKVLIHISFKNQELFFFIVNVIIVGLSSLT